MNTKEDLSTVQEVEQWMSRYYESPRPDLTQSAIKVLSESGQLRRENMLETITSFLSYIFRANPDKIEAWLSPFTDLSDEETQVIANALWYSDTKQANDYLVTLSAAAEIEMKHVFVSLLTEQPTPIDEMPIIAPAVLDMLWAAFMATGEEQYVVRIISALPYANAEDDTAERMIGEAASWSLKSNAAHNKKVLSIAESELHKQPEDVASILREIIEEVQESGLGA